MRVVTTAVAAVAISLKLSGSPGCMKLPEHAERTERMLSDFGQRQPGRGIRLQMLARALRLLKEERNATAAECPTKTRPRRFCDCEECEGRTPTMLWTFPGSGNTFTRTLIEASTSIYTGSVFGDGGIWEVMPGERAPTATLIDCERLAVIKAHPNKHLKEIRDCAFPVFNICSLQVTKVVIVTRHPFSAAWAEFLRNFTAHHKQHSDPHNGGSEHDIQGLAGLLGD